MCAGGKHEGEGRQAQRADQSAARSVPPHIPPLPQILDHPKTLTIYGLPTLERDKHPETIGFRGAVYAVGASDASGSPSRARFTN
jgi:hypothetical protein